jgi:hypothetical protein
MPDGQFLTDVCYNVAVPTWFGAFSDVHEGTWSGTRVVVKRLRVYEGRDKSVINQVRTTQRFL